MPSRYRFSAVAAVIAAGLALPLFGPGFELPFAVTKYGGSLLCGTMVCGFVGAAWPAAGIAKAVTTAPGIATAIEVSRPVHKALRPPKAAPCGRAPEPTRWDRAA